MSMTAEGVLKELTGRSVETRMSDAIRADVEKKANVDLSGVRLFYNSDLLSRTGEMAFTKGNQIHMQKDAFSQGSFMGKKILTHELNHVIQQGTGKVSGSGIVSDAAMETQADSGAGLNAEGFSMPSFATSAAQGFKGFGLLDAYRKKHYSHEIEIYMNLLEGNYSRSLTKQQRMQKQLLERRLPEVARLAQEQYNKNKKKELDQVSAADTRFMTPAEMVWFHEQKHGEWATGKNGFNKGSLSTGIMMRAEQDDDFSNYFKMSNVAKLALATQKQRKDLNTLDKIQGLDENDNVTSLNPAIRKAMQIMAKEGKREEQRAEGGDAEKIAFGQESFQKGLAMDQNMMKKTMYATTADQNEKIAEFFQRGGEAERRDQSELSRLNFFEKKVLRYGGQVQNEDEARSHHQAASNLLLKTMLLAQLGNTTYHNEDTGQRTDWNYGMANLFGNGARTAIITPTNDAGGAGADSEQLFSNFMGDSTLRGLKEKGVNTRAAATHGFRPEVVNRQTFWEKHGMLRGLKSVLTAPFRRMSKKGAGAHVIRHYGMDAAIGGIGNDGVTGTNARPQMIMNDGRSGHVYMGILSGNEKQKGTILIGAESDSPYHTGQTGHMHNAAAKGEDATNTGGLKSGLIGRKYNGRKIDVSGYSNASIVALMKAIDQLGQIDPNQPNNEARQEAQNQASTLRNTVVDALSGTRLDGDAFRAVLQNLGINEELIEQILANRH